MKQHVLKECISFLNSKIKTAEKLIQSAELSAQSDTKSSAGDKFETGREMAMIEKVKATKQLESALAMKKAIESLPSNTLKSKVEIGNLVTTDKGIFFIAVSLGQISVNNKNIFVISGNAPIGKLLLGKVIGDTISFNNIDQKITNIQ